MDSQDLTDNGYVVHIKNARLEHSGGYTCYGESVKGMFLRKSKFISKAHVTILGE